MRTLDSQVTWRCYKDHTAHLFLSFGGSKLKSIAQPFIPCQNTNVNHWQKQSWYTFMLLIKGKCRSSTGTSTEIPFFLWNCLQVGISAQVRMAGNSTWAVPDIKGRKEKGRGAINKLGTEYGSIYTRYMCMRVSVCMWEREICVCTCACVCLTHTSPSDVSEWSSTGCLRRNGFINLAPFYEKFVLIALLSLAAVTITNANAERIIIAVRKLQSRARGSPGRTEWWRNIREGSED